VGSLPFDALEPGMTLAADLNGPDGKMLLPKGIVLTDSHLKSLRARGVTRAVIAEEGDAPAEVSIPPELLEKSQGHVDPNFFANDLGHPAIETLYSLAVTRLATALTQGRPLPADPPPNPRAESMGDLFFRAEGGAKDIVSSEVKLASFPDIYFKIRRVLDSPSSSAAQVADVISKDTSLSAKLLKLVNSPFYGLPQRIDSISRAVMVIGGQEISTLALGISAINAFKDIPPELLNMRTFWEHSVAVGVFARTLGKATRHGAGERLFVAGILHDIGRLIIYKKLPHAAVEAIYYAKANQVPLYVAENDVIGFTHPLVGGLLLRAWKFPEALVATVAFHHKPSASPDNIEPAILHLADIMAVALGMSPPASSMVPTLEPTAWDALDLAPDSLAELAAEGLSQVEDIVNDFFPVRKN
jgi:HD-like signal output (HDOD) protein